MAAEEPQPHPGTNPTPPQPPAVLPDTGPNVTQNNGTLGFTNSTYGNMIPIVYGADRLAGNVIWASAPVTVTAQINGQPFVYQVISFAIAICEGPINGLLRMWIGANLMIDNTMTVNGSNVAQPGADGVIGAYTIDITDPTSAFANLDSAARQTSLIVYNGNETQMPDPLMVFVEGYESVPGYRGLAYVMFNNFIITNNSLPAIFFEITSHTVSQSPRVFGDLIATTFDTWRYDSLNYDPSFDRFYAIGTKTSPSAKGYIVLNGNTGLETNQFEINTAFSINPQYDTTAICPISGHLVVTAPSGNAGNIYTINRRTGALLNTLGPGGNLSGHGIAGNGIAIGMAVLGSATVAAFICPDSLQVPRDVFVGVGTINQSVGFAQIDDDGLITMLSTLNAVTPWINNAIGVLPHNPDFFAASTLNRLFYDAYSSWGTHIYGFSWRNNENTSFKVWRVTVSRTSAAGGTVVVPTAPVYKELAAIPVDRFGGTGFTYSIRIVMLDRQDQCFVLVVDSNSRGSFICKYSPFSGLTRWITSITTLPGSINSQQGTDWGLLRGSYAWIDSAGVVWRINLSNGQLTKVIASLTGQSMPALSNAHQFYNGFENSISYLTATASQHFAKLYVDRLTRTTVELSDIVIDLIKRTGLLESDVNVVDLVAITLNGYTINSIRSVRQALAELQQVFTYDVVESNGKIRYKTRGNGVDLTIPHDYIQGNSKDATNAWLEVSQTNDGSRLRKINLTYRDINRDYASNVQSVVLSRYGNQVFDPEAFIDVTVPIALDANTAKQLAEILIYAKLTYNTTYKFTLAPRYLNADAADVITLTMPPGEDNVTVRLRTVTIGPDNFVQCEASEENADIYNDQIDLFGATGRFETQRIPPVPPRIDVLALQIPGRSRFEIDETRDKHRVFLTFLNASYVVLSQYITAQVDGVNYTVPPPAKFPTWGYVVTPPVTTHAFGSTDNVSTVVIDIQNTGNSLIASAINGKADLLASDTVNLCYISGELFQFVTAVNLSGSRWQFTELHRAKFGSDAFVGLALAGDHFVLLAGNDGVLDEDGVTVLTVPIGVTPIKSVQVFMNTGNPFQPPFSSPVTAINLRPWAVADFQASYVATDAVMTWQYRDRIGDGSYPDNGGVPPAELVPMPEKTETYDLYLYTNPATFNAALSSTYLRKVTVTTNTFTYTSAMQTADSFVRTTTDLYIAIQENGSWSGVDNGVAQQYLLSHV